jgi:hypothetical protein
MGISHSKAAPALNPRASKPVLDKQATEDIEDMVKFALGAHPETTDDLTTPVTITVALQDMPVMGFYFVNMFERSGTEDWVPLGVTEMSEASQAPQFVRNVKTEYSFEVPKYIRMDVYRHTTDMEMAEVKRGEEAVIPPKALLISSTECPIAEAIVSQDGCSQKNLQDGGSIMMFVDETRAMQTMIYFELKLVELDTANLPKTKKPRNLCAAIYRTVTGSTDKLGTRPQVAHSESIGSAADKGGFIRDVAWQGMKLPVNALCRSDPDHRIEFDVCENTGKTLNSVGSCFTTLREMEKASKNSTTIQLTLKGPRRATFAIHNIQIERKDTFMDYIAGGLSINLFVAIDFTKSNKEPTQPDSLHQFVDPSRPNDYVKVIRSVGEILQAYDNDRKVPVYGFGARLPPAYNHTSHCFACDGDFFNPEVVGVDEIINVYRKALDSVVMHGPTNFHEIIKLVADFTEVYADPEIGNHKYSVLLILTDGVITDMKQTINEIVRAAEFPMSIVIVGIGDEDFGLMKILDGDEERLYSTDERKFASRDIVQFVKFNDYKDKPIQALAAETLAEIPREVVNYFKSRDIVPRSKPPSETANENQEVNVDGSSLGTGEMASDIAKQLSLMKSEFLEQVTKVVTDIDEFEVYRIITDERVPSRDLTYFKEIVAKAPRGSNVFTIPKPADVDSPAAKAKRSMVPSPAKVVSPPRAPASPAPVIDMSNENPADLASQGKPIGSPISTLSPAQRQKIAGSFTVADMLGNQAVGSPRAADQLLKPGQVPAGAVASVIHVEEPTMRSPSVYGKALGSDTPTHPISSAGLPVPNSE